MRAGGRLPGGAAQKARGAGQHRSTAVHDGSHSACAARASTALTRSSCSRERKYLESAHSSGILPVNLRSRGSRDRLCPGWKPLPRPGPPAPPGPAPPRPARPGPAPPRPAPPRPLSHGSCRPATYAPAHLLPSSLRMRRLFSWRSLMGRVPWIPRLLSCLQQRGSPGKALSGGSVRRAVRAAS